MIGDAFRTYWPPTQHRMVLALELDKQPYQPSQTTLEGVSGPESHPMMLFHRTSELHVRVVVFAAEVEISLNAVFGFQIEVDANLPLNPQVDAFLVAMERILEVEVERMFESHADFDFEISLSFRFI